MVREIEKKLSLLKFCIEYFLCQCTDFKDKITLLLNILDFTFIVTRGEANWTNSLVALVMLILFFCSAEYSEDSGHYIEDKNHYQTIFMPGYRTLFNVRFSILCC